MDDQTNQGGMGQGTPASPMSGAGGASSAMGGMPPAAEMPTVKAENEADVHARIEATLARIEEKVNQIAAKSGV